MIISSKTPEISRVVRASGVNGKRNGDVSVIEFRGPRTLNSYWDGGSKEEYCLVDMVTLKTWSMPTSHPYFDRRPDGQRCGNLEIAELPPNVCLVQGGTFCGKPASIRIHVRPENLEPLLPAPGPELSDAARKALNIIGGIKGGYRRDEFSRANLGPYAADNPVVAELELAGLVKVNKAGAISITTAGKNAR